MDIVLEVEEASGVTVAGAVDAIGPAARESSARREERRKIPAERSGGGW